MPGVAAVTAGPGITNTITALKNAQLAQSPVILIGGAAPTALQGRGALQDIDQRPLVAPHVKRFLKMRRVRELGPAVAEAFALARSGVPGPVFIECPVDLLYDEATIRQWYADAAGKGNALADRAAALVPEPPCRNDVRRQRRRGRALAARCPAAARRRQPALRTGRGRAAQGRAAADGHRQPGAGARASRPRRWPRRSRALGVPVYLSGMARGLLGRDHPLQMRHQRRKALREADCVLLAGVPCDFRLDYGSHMRRSATLIAANRSAQGARLNRRPDVAAIGDAGQFIAGAGASGAGAGRRAAGHLDRTCCARATAEREADIDTQAAAQRRIRQPDGLLARARAGRRRQRAVRRRRR